MRKDCVTSHEDVWRVCILPTSYRLSWFVTQRFSLFCNAHKNGRRLVSYWSNVFCFQCSFLLDTLSLMNSRFSCWCFLTDNKYNFENHLASIIVVIVLFVLFFSIWQTVTWQKYVACRRKDAHLFFPGKTAKVRSLFCFPLASSFNTLCSCEECVMG